MRFDGDVSWSWTRRSDRTFHVAVTGLYLPELGACPVVTYRGVARCPLAPTVEFRAVGLNVKFLPMEEGLWPLEYPRVRRG